MRIALLFVIFVSLCVCEACSKPQSVELKTKQDSVAYSIGMNVGKSMKQDSLMLDLDIVKAALYDAIYTDQTQLTEEQARKVLQSLQQEIKENRMKNKKADGEKFLAENKSQPGVTTLPDGLQYKVIKAGTGKTPTPKDTVKVHYTGTFTNGQKFDSSIDRNEPAQFPVTGVIKGWTEALLMMKEGDKWMLYIPSELAYGPRGNQGIAPNETLIFEVELLEVLSAK